MGKYVRGGGGGKKEEKEKEKGVLVARTSSAALQAVSQLRGPDRGAIVDSEMNARSPHFVRRKGVSALLQCRLVLLFRGLWLARSILNFEGKQSMPASPLCKLLIRDSAASVSEVIPNLDVGDGVVSKTLNGPSRCP